MFEKKHDKILGHYIDLVSVKITEAAKERFPTEVGPLTALLSAAMESGLIDAAIVTDKDDDFRPFPTIATNQKELIKGAG